MKCSHCGDESGCPVPVVHVVISGSVVSQSWRLRLCELCQEDVLADIAKAVGEPEANEKGGA